MRGKFIGFEGIDGSGKGTQHRKALGALDAQRIDIVEFDFPQYDTPSGVIVSKYLNGEFGTDLDPKLASTFFAYDRLSASTAIKSAIGRGALVLTNRFTMSNAGHQGQKISDQSQREAFYDWLLDLEHNLMGIPSPDAYILYRINPDIAQANVDKKERRAYTRDRDIHETDIEHLRKAAAVYDELSLLYPEKFKVIDCMANETTMLSQDDIHNATMEVLQRELRGEV